MTLNFYTLGVIYLVYSFLGWVAETVVATIRGGRFANRGAAAGPFCFIYGTTGVLLAVSFGDLRTEPVYLFFACMMAATVMEWITAKLLERLHRRKWWDYSGKKFNLNGYVCLQYSLLWGALGTASVLWGNNVLLRLCAHIPVWLLRPAVWVSLTVAVLDQIGSAVLVQRYAARHPMLEQLNQRLGERSDTLRRRIALYIEKRIQYAYPAAARQEQTALRKGEKNFLSVSDLLWLFVIGAFLGDMVETVFCRVTAGVWMSRSSLVWGPFSVVWGLALVLAVFVFEMSGQRAPVPVGTAELAVRLLLELSVGFLLGMAVSCFLYIPQLAGLVVDTQMGMTMNQIYDAGAQANLSVTGGVLNVLLLLLFFAGNGHHTLLRIVMTSGEVVPFGEAALSSAAANAMLSLFVECTVLGIKLCMPILAAELLGQVGMGVLMKAIPQINVFSINIELKVLIGLILLLLLISPFSEFLLQAELTMFDRLRELLALTV